MRSGITRVLSSCLLATLWSCASSDEIRGEDDDALVGAFRARIARPLPEPPPAADGKQQRVQYRPALELGADYVEGDFTQPVGRGEYEVFRMYAAFTPELSFGDVCFAPMIGTAFGSAEVSSGTRDADLDVLGVFVGAEVSLRASSWLQPYARYSVAGFADLGLEQIETGVDLRVTDETGFLLAYTWKTNEIDDFVFDQSARVESNGLFLGLSLRF